VVVNHVEFLVKAGDHRVHFAQKVTIQNSQSKYALPRLTYARSVFYHARGPFEFYEVSLSVADELMRAGGGSPGLVVVWLLFGGLLLVCCYYFHFRDLLSCLIQTIFALKNKSCEKICFRNASFWLAAWVCRGCGSYMSCMQEKREAKMMGLDLMHY
jgi:hypothetical protein